MGLAAHGFVVNSSPGGQWYPAARLECGCDSGGCTTGAACTPPTGVPSVLHVMWQPLHVEKDGWNGSITSCLSLVCGRSCTLSGLRRLTGSSHTKAVPGAGSIQAQHNAGGLRIRLFALPAATVDNTVDLLEASPQQQEGGGMQPSI